LTTEVEPGGRLVGVTQSLRLAGYRFRATAPRRRAGYLSLVLCIGLLGGLAMGAAAGARRTQSSFPEYFASANPPDLFGITSIINPLLGSDLGYNAAIVRSIALLPHVERVESASGIDVLPLTPSGHPISLGFPPAAGNSVGSVDGLYFDLVRVTIVGGRMADPNRVDEVMMLKDVAAMSSLHVGDTFRVGIYTNAQTQLPLFGTARVKPIRALDVKLVGTFVQPQALIQDDVDNSASQFFFTPAFTKTFLSCCSNYTGSAVKVAGGSHWVSLVDTEIQHLLPKGFPPPSQASTVVTKAQRAIQPEAIALGVFGLIAALAALLVAGQVIGRQVRRAGEERGVLRALGAAPTTIAGDSLLGVLAAILAGSVLAVIVAVAISPLAPIGPVRPVYPYLGPSFDWRVLGAGFVVLLIGLGLWSVVLAAQEIARLSPAKRTRAAPRAAWAPRAAARAGFPPSAVTGIRFALEPGAGATAVPVRSAMLGAGLAMAMIVATVTFGASLNSLVSHPNLYGWNWNYILSAGGGSGNIPQAESSYLLSHDRYVGAWSAAYFDDLVIDGQSVPVIGESPGASVQPPILSGHRLEAPNEIVLGAITLSELHKHAGETVLVQNGITAAVRLTIVGTATMPTIGGPGPHLEMGTGAVLDYRLIPPAARNPFNDPVVGPESIFVDVRAGSSLGQLDRSLQNMTGPLSNNFNFGVFVASLLRPAEIVNYRSMGSTPALLGSALCVGALAALSLTLLASVRRRRRDLALLKALGFTKWQLATAIAWQSSVAVAIGTLVGVPIGIALGRFLWDLFANEIHAIPQPAVPSLSVAAIAGGGLILANLIAAVPGAIASSTRTSVLLRAE
jgi:hypothetical protein